MSPSDDANAKSAAVPDWESLLDAATKSRPPAIKAVTFLSAMGSFSRPFRVTCDDGQQYVVKARRQGRGADLDRGVLNDQIVGRLAILLNAPVPPVTLVDIQDLSKIEASLADAVPPFAHGSRNIPNVTDRKGLENINVAENRHRFAGLTLLYSWLGCFSDHQLLYSTTAPELVYSVDHGHFLGNAGPVWACADLQGRGSAQIDSFFGACALKELEFLSARHHFESVTPQGIAMAIAAPPDEWGITLQERVCLAEYLWKRQSALIGAWTVAH